MKDISNLDDQRFIDEAIETCPKMGQDAAPGFNPHDFLLHFL